MFARVSLALLLCAVAARAVQTSSWLCEDLNSCAECQDDLNTVGDCGWCTTLNQCFNGTADGAFGGVCPVAQGWLFDTCPVPPVVDVAGAIIASLCVIIGGFAWSFGYRYVIAAVTCAAAVQGFGFPYIALATLTTWPLGATLSIAAVFGVVVLWVAWRWRETGYFLVGTVVGFALGGMLLASPVSMHLQQPNAHTGVVLGAGLLAGALAVCGSRLGLMAIICVGGSYSTFLGIDYFLWATGLLPTNLPQTLPRFGSLGASAFSQSGLWALEALGLYGATIPMPSAASEQVTVYIMLMALLLFTAGGALLFQWKISGAGIDHRCRGRSLLDAMRGVQPAPDSAINESAPLLPRTQRALTSPVT